MTGGLLDGGRTLLLEPDDVADLFLLPMNPVRDLLLQP